MIGFEGSGRRTTTRLLAGEFPRYQSLLPKTVNAAAELSVSLLSESVKRVALVAERNTPVRLSFSAGQLMLEAGTGDEAQAEEIIEAEFSGDDLSIAFNPQYLLDGLTAIDSDIVRISFTEPGKPALLTGKPGPGWQPGVPVPADADPPRRLAHRGGVAASLGRRAPDPALAYRLPQLRGGGRDPRARCDDVPGRQRPGQDQPGRGGQLSGDLRQPPGRRPTHR